MNPEDEKHYAMINLIVSENSVLSKAPEVLGHLRCTFLHVSPLRMNCIYHIERKPQKIMIGKDAGRKNIHPVQNESRLL